MLTVTSKLGSYSFVGLVILVMQLYVDIRCIPLFARVRRSGITITYIKVIWPSADANSGIQRISTFTYYVVNFLTPSVILYTTLLPLNFLCVV